MSHLLAIVILLLKIWKTRSCAGISGKSQLMFALVFVTRYLDLITNFVSVYNTVMKVFYLSASIGTCYLIFLKFKATYDGNHDSFRMEFLIAPAAGLACLVNHQFNVMEVLWTFSIYRKIYKEWELHTIILFSKNLYIFFHLEAVAILPQLFMISKTGEAESITSHYLFALGMYRALYRKFWIKTRKSNKLFESREWLSKLLFICSTGSTDTTTKDFTIWLQSAPVLFKLFYTATSSTSTLPKLLKAKRSNCQHKKWYHSQKIILHYKYQIKHASSSTTTSSSFILILSMKIISTKINKVCNSRQTPGTPYFLIHYTLQNIFISLSFWVSFTSTLKLF